jgi:molybdopterin-containing oxidoreductase family membrane subunit
MEVSPMNKNNQNILGIYTYVDVLIDTIKRLRSEGYEDLRVFSPAPNHEIEDALDTGKEPSKVKYFTFCGAILGALVGVCFTVLTSIDWPIVTSAKPIVSIPPYMIIIFECMILIGGLSTFLGLLINSRLRKDTPPELYDERFSDNKFGILVSCGANDLEKIENIFRDSGTDEVQINGVLKEEAKAEEVKTEETEPEKVNSEEVKTEETETEKVNSEEVKTEEVENEN